MNEKHLVKLLWAAKAGLLVVLVCLGVGIVTDSLHRTGVLNPRTASGDQPAVDEQAPSSETYATPDYAALARSSLFGGTGGGGNSQEATSHAPVPDTLPSAEDLGLRVIGAVAGSPEASRAIIQNTKNNVINVYRVGDTISPALNEPDTGTPPSEKSRAQAKPQAGVTIEAIRRDAVVLCYQGRSSVLRLRTGTAADGKVSSGKENPPSPKGASASAAGPAGVPTLPRSNRGEYVTEVLRKATIEPYVKDNQTEGLQITGLENIPMATLFGLRNGDVIQSVDGQKLTSKQKAFQVLMKAKAQPKISIRLLRDGKSQDVSIGL